jgi:peroxiredoxin
MKKIIATILVLFPAFWLAAQTASIPSVELRDLNGKIVPSSQLMQPASATLLVFWKSSSGKCCANLEEMRQAWEETLKAQGVRLVAICVDCNGSWTQARAVVDGNGWDFDTYIDVNGDFMRAMCVGEVPCSMLYDQNQNLLCRYNSGCSGSQEYICENIMAHLASSVIAYEAQADK